MASHEFACVFQLRDGLIAHIRGLRMIQLRKMFLAAVLLASAGTAGAWGYRHAFDLGAHQAPVTVQGPAQVSVGFSPEGSGEALVLKTIESAQRTIRVSAYSFTSAPVVKALIDAKRRGVDVMVLVDRKANTEGNAYGRHALNALVNAGVPVHTIGVYPIYHDKTIVADDTVETGSFNYSKAAAQENSENVIVLWHDAALADVYLRHWRSRWEQGQNYQPGYAPQSSEHGHWKRWDEHRAY